MDLYQKYRESAARFLALRPRSEKEVRDNLLKKKAPVDIIERVIVWLKEQRFLNDEEFAAWWIEQRARFKPKGTLVIRMELKQKGISREIIQKFTSSSEQPVVDLEAAKEVIKKRISKYQHLERQELYIKLGSFLARRGFGWETIKKAIDSEYKPLLP